MKLKDLVIRPLTALALLIMVFIIWQFFLFLRPRQRPYSDAEIRAIQRAAAAAAAEMAAQIGAPARFGVAHLRGDWKDRFGEELCTAIAARPGFTVLEGSPIRRFLDDIGNAILDATSIEDVLKAGQKVRMDVLVAGRVLSVGTAEGVSTARAEILAYDTRVGAWVVRGVFEGRWAPNPAARATAALSRMVPWKRFGLWLVIVGALPWLTPFLTRRALASKTNAASLALIGTYTLVALFLALLFTGFQISGAAATIRLLATIVVAAFYNYWACERIAARERA